MGSYTSVFKLYKPSADEFVDVNTQLNPNWDTVDEYCKKLMEFQYFTGTSVSDTVGATNLAGERWYKTYSNSILCAAGPNDFFQDTYARVSNWLALAPYLDTSSITWAAFPGQEPFYRIISSSGSTTEIEMVGRVWNSGAAIQELVTYNIFTGLPSGIVPTVNKYFQQYAGNTSTGYAMARVLVRTDNKIEFQKYGTGTATSSNENYVDLGGIKYNLEVAA